MLTIRTAQMVIRRHLETNWEKIGQELDDEVFMYLELFKVQKLLAHIMPSM